MRLSTHAFHTTHSPTPPFHTATTSGHPPACSPQLRLPRWPHLLHLHPPHVPPRPHPPLRPRTFTPHTSQSHTPPLTIPHGASTSNATPHPHLTPSTPHSPSPQSRLARLGQLVGFGRATSDGVLSATIWDVAVAPAWQRAGLGRALMERLTARLVADGIPTITLVRGADLHADVRASKCFSPVLIRASSCWVRALQ